MHKFVFRAAFLFSLSPSMLFASADDISQISQSSQWLSLLHYNQVGVIKQEGSQIEDAKFFLSANGQRSPEAELKATLAALSQPQPSGTAADEHAQCRFPARKKFLQDALPSISFPDIQCPEFEEWQGQLDAEKVVLIFPAAYLNSPSSMYGHTLFRLKKKGNDAPLLDYAVNYAANTDPTDNQLVFSYKGLTGGYPGVVSVMPYYQKVKEYNFLENRDIWEYELSLTPDEVDMFVRHVWEMKGTSMPYYFFSQNCSYQLLTMLDAASPRLQLAEQFSVWAIPADTVREIKRQGLIEEATYRPSTLNNIENMLDQVSSSQIEAAKRLVEDDQLDTSLLDEFSVLEKAQTLDVAYEYSRYLSARKKSTISHLGLRSIQLLSLRSKLPSQEAFTPVSVPLVRDDQGHQTARLSVGVEQRDDLNFGVLEYRPSYHDVLDPQGGYLRGAELSMFSGGLRWSDDRELEVDHINLVNIHSMAPINALMTPKSWHVNASFLRDITVDDELVFRLQGGAGITLPFGRSLLAGFWNASASLDDVYNDGYVAETGPAVKWLWNGEKANVMAEYQYWLDVNEHNAERQNVELALSYEFIRDWQWRVELNHTKNQQDEWDSAKVSLLRFF